MQVNPGDLNKKIQVVQLVKTEDADGFDTVTEKVVRRCWAKVSNTSGTEMIKANAEFAEVKKRFLVRASGTPLDTDMAVKYHGKLYGIVYINEYSDNHEYLEIWTEMKELV